MNKKKKSLIRKPNIITRKIKGLNIILDYENSSVIEFNEIASLIWDLSISENTIDTLVYEILKRYNVDKSIVVQDTYNFFSKHRELFIDPKRENRSESKIAINDVIADQLEKIGKKYTIPVFTDIELTQSCSLRCVHCNVVKTKEPDLKKEELIDIISQLESIGCFVLTFTGGEIFTRRDILDILIYADSRKFAINLLTSASNLSFDQIDTISNLKINNVQVSIYSTDSEVHDDITQIKGSFSRSIKNIELMLAKNINVTISCVIMNKNLLHYKSVETLAKKIGAKFATGYPIRARDDGSTDNFKFRLSEKEIYCFFKDYAERFLKGFKRNLDDQICHAGNSICMIRSKGEILPCIIFPSKINFGNLRQNRFEEIWNNSEELIKFRNLKLKDTYKCKKCDLMNYCQICPGLSLLEEGDLLAPAKINCLTANSISKILNFNKKGD
ncbi:MAG: PqqD family peptide modification chaperone [Candidatus Omnitrophota bacterium]